MSLKRKLKEKYFRKVYPQELIDLAVPMGMDLIDFIQHYGGIRNDVLKLVPPNVKRVLDVGCASGITGQILKSRGAEEVVGIELEPTIAEFAKERLDNVLVGNVEKLDIPYEEGYFDLIMYNDILEHLYDPWELVKKHSKHLSPTGCFIMGIPNVQHFHSLLNILVGRWDYVETGLFAKIHIRFFCYKNIKDLVKSVGHKIDKVHRNYKIFKNTILLKGIAPFISLFIFRRFFVYQYVVRTKKQ